MHAGDAAELYVRATPEQVAQALLPRTATAGTTFTADGSWHPTPWSHTLAAWRREGRWERGRASGRVTVDLVPADAERTLVLVTLTPAPRGAAGRRAQGTAAALADHLRTLAENRAAAVGRRPLPRRDAAAVPARPRPAAAAV